MQKVINSEGQTYPWVDPLGTSHFGVLKPIQLQNNIGLT
jgi:hypothetical protein